MITARLLWLLIYLFSLLRKASPARTIATKPYRCFPEVFHVLRLGCVVVVVDRGLPSHERG